MLGEAVFERVDDPLGVQGYHVGGFTYIGQSLDILRSFIIYFLWSEKCRKHFNNQYSSRKILQQAWVATIEVGCSLERSLIPFDPLGTPVFKLGLIKPLRRNGVT
jgi:hypothetical protein